MNLPKIPYDEWFEGKKPHPHDSMPIATDKENTYASRHESTPAFEKDGGAEEVVTMHEKMYKIATSKYNPFSVGGSESIHDFDKGSEQIWADDLPDLAPSEYEP